MTHCCEQSYAWDANKYNTTVELADTVPGRIYRMVGWDDESDHEFPDKQLWMRLKPEDPNSNPVYEDSLAMHFARVVPNDGHVTTFFEFDGHSCYTCDFPPGFTPPVKLKRR